MSWQVPYILTFYGTLPINASNQKRNLYEHKLIFSKFTGGKMSEEDKKSDLKIFIEELIRRNIEKLSSEDEKIVEKLDDEEIVRLIEKIAGSNSYSLLRCLAVLEDEIDEKNAAIVYGCKFEEFDELIGELTSCGLLERQDSVIYFPSPALKEVLQTDDAEAHSLASDYYYTKAKETNKFDDYFRGFKHNLKTDNIEKSLELFFEVSRNAKGNEDSVIKEGEKLINRVNGIKLGEVLRALGSLAYDCGLLERANQYYSEAIQIYMDYSNKEPEVYMPELAKLMNNLGNVCNSSGRYDEAESHFKWAATIFTKLNNPENLAITLENLGIVYVDAERYEDAEKTLKEVIELRMDLLKGKDVSGISSAYHKLANVYWLQKRVDESERTFKKLIEILDESKEEDSVPFLANAKTSLASFYIDTGKYDECIEVAKDVLSDLKLVPEIRTRIYSITAKAYEKKGERDKAAELYLKAAALAFILFRQYGIFVSNFIFLLEKVEELSSGEIRGDANLMRQAILKNYYGQKRLEIRDVECGKKGQMILHAVKGKSISSFKVESQEEMAAYLIANDIN